MSEYKLFSVIYMSVMVIVTVAVIVTLFVTIAVKLSPAEAVEVGSCPDGQTQIGSNNGRAICRITPGQCLNGDSVPADKCQR